MKSLDCGARSNPATPADSRGEYNARLQALLFALLVGLSSIPFDAAIAAEREKEYRIKAAFVVNFASLVEWPPEAFNGSEDAIVVCHVGDKETKSLLDSAYSGRTIDQRVIEVRQLTAGRGMIGCHIVLITTDRDEQGNEFITAAAGKSILTIGEADDFARSGGMIGFYKEGSKIRFEINLEAARREKLRISSRLLQLARLVSSEVPQVAP